MPLEKSLRIDVPEPFDLRVVLFSHGWIDLEPHRFDESSRTFETTFELADMTVVTAVVREDGKALNADLQANRALGATALRECARRLARQLGIDGGLDEFWESCREEWRRSWIAERGAGRIMRAASFFEDLMKVLFTTNCTWAATRLMVRRLVEGLGREGANGRRAFPSAEVCLEAGEKFFAEVVRCGYRARAAMEVSEACLDGGLESELAALVSTPKAFAARVRRLRGFGPYAAGQMMRLQGCHEDLAIDSWCRMRYRSLSGAKRVVKDAAIERAYREYGSWRGLVFWLDLTAEWHGESFVGSTELRSKSNSKSKQRRRD